MYVQRVLTFIDALNKSGNLIHCDTSFYVGLVERFSRYQSRDLLSAADIQFLLSIFKTRWQQVVDTENDYLLNSAGINEVWIQFAKDLASCTTKNYLQILLPNIRNILDFNNLTPLTETEKFENFYLGQGGETLYRKRGLCEHLISKEYDLSTYRGPKHSVLSSLTIAELTRLKSCRQNNSEFSINKENFTNFWDFLHKKVFPRLQFKGNMPPEILLHLFLVLEKYYALKNTGSDFVLFKSVLKSFYDRLSQTELDNINYFYGSKVQCDGHEYYLFDLLIDISKAQSYKLDEQIKALASWLFQYNSVLKINSPELHPIYEELTRGYSLGSAGLQLSSIRRNIDRRCLELIVSLLTVTFDFLPFTGRAINLWDRTNIVSPEAAEIYDLFFPLLSTKNNAAELLPTYEIVMKDYIRADKDNFNFYTWLTQTNSTKEWYQFVDEDKLSKLDIYWFEPEVLLAVLLKYKTGNQVLAKQINTFIDELVHTYAQNNTEYTELMKQLRVNLVFAGFMKNLDAQNKRYLLILLQLHDVQEDKKSFLNNCINYISFRLSQMSVIHSGSSVQFFSSVRKVEESMLPIPSAGAVNKVNGILDAYKRRLHSPELRLHPALMEKMSTYLLDVSRPILTVAEKDEARSSSGSLDYLGAPT